MLNAEKYIEEISQLISKGKSFAVSKDGTNVIRYCPSFECKNCIFNDEGYGSCDFRRIKWLLSKYKEPIKLTRLEYELLKFWNVEGYKYIARDRDKRLYAYKEKPTKKYDCWGCMCGHRMINDFVALFQFVKWEDEEPTSIKEVLKNCIVENIKMGE